MGLRGISCLRDFGIDGKGEEETRTREEKMWRTAPSKKYRVSGVGTSGGRLR